MKMKAATPVLALGIVTTSILSYATLHAPDTISQTQVMAGTTPQTDPNDNTMFGDVTNTRLFDIVALANSNHHLSTFAELLEHTSLNITLRSGGPYTVFIPTNEAFSNLHPEQLQQLTRPESSENLKRLLQAHIVAGELYSSSLDTIEQLKTTEGVEISVAPEQGGYVTIDGARIVKPNVAVSNGIVHIVDKVILNEPETAKPREKL